MMQVVHLVDETRLVLRFFLACNCWSVLTSHHICKAFKFYGNIVSGRFIKYFVTVRIRLRRACLHPGVHLGEDKIQALLRVCFLV